MVKSQTVSITAANHAGRHIHGGADPLAGDIRSTYVVPHSGYELGSGEYFNNATEKSTTSAVYAKIKEIAIIRYAGVVRVSFSLAKNTGGTAYGKIYINGVAVGAEHTAVNGAGWLVHSDDITVANGDLVQLYAHDGGTAGDAKAKDMKILGTLVHDAPNCTSQDP